MSGIARPGLFLKIIDNIDEQVDTRRLEELLQDQDALGEVS